MSTCRHCGDRVCIECQEKDDEIERLTDYRDDWKELAEDYAVIISELRIEVKEIEEKEEQITLLLNWIANLEKEREEWKAKVMGRVAETQWKILCDYNKDNDELRERIKELEKSRAGKTVTLHYRNGDTWPDDIEVKKVTPVDD